MVTAPSASQTQVDRIRGGPITVGVDEGGRSTSAVLWAAGEAERSGRSLRLVAAYTGTGEFTRSREQAERDLANLSRRLFLSNLECRVEAGPSPEVLLDAAHTSSALVVGRRGGAGARRLLIGSTSLRVASASPVPVVVVPDRWIQPTMVVKPLVVGIGPASWNGAGTIGTHQDEEVLRFGFDRAADLRVPLLLLTARKNPSPYAWVAADAGRGARYRGVLELRLSSWRAQYPDVEVVAHTFSKAPQETILEAARVAQLIIVGRTAGNRQPLHLGSTARGVLHHAERPVAIIPTPLRSAPAGGRDG